ncbi:tRNA nucleotidyltransferase (CCA-adding enzyme) [Anoxybacillus tepidamans]|uniref:CCA-adding enzyme n=1 Tax=Anoxybacteroides tepidamans TaxID=265948 RepID=A0A7W8IPB2_9BACL|nr:CCA tRNA nucleotidyltransferase [Anoxybacillus tepidamans]MBB5323377.1 tRNA nucleotidyltransferase (CCA-adding enzyme) [Anoxybacillus tepidamans]
MKEPFRRALGLIRTLKQHGYEAYFVGGAVRDHLLNRPIGDVDIATSALPEEVMAIFPKTVPVGLKHGTVVVLHDGTPYEVTTFRTEGTYEKYRRPESVTFVRSLRKDLERRDFTMNAIAMDETGQLIDLFGGQQAIAERIIRTVGDAKARFSEDALRMMRAIRFVSQLGFALSAETKQAIIEHASLLSYISVERITGEFEKLMEGPFAQKAFSLLVETGLFTYLPGFSDKQEELMQLAKYDWTKLSAPLERWSLLCYLLHVQQEVSVFLRRWKLPNRLIKDVQTILRFLSVVRSRCDWTRERMYEAGATYAYAAETVRSLINGEDGEDNRRRLRELFAKLPIQERNELAITGKDLIEWYQRPGGPWLADTLQKVEQAVLHGLVENEKERIKGWLILCNQTHGKNC